MADKTMTDWQKEIHEWAVRKEWRGPNSSKRPFVADLALFTSEISEALEEVRKNANVHHYYETYTIYHEGVKFSNLTIEQCKALGVSQSTIDKLPGKPEGVGPELADLLIRVLETFEEYELNSDFEVERKMAYNEGRELKHGGLLM